MHPTDHVTDEQLNEYLDNESGERAQIETHLSTCDECAARFTALKTLFTEIESLPELELTHNLAARFMTPPSLPANLWRWLTLTATLQAAVAITMVVIAAPFISNLLPPLQTPSFTDVLIQIQTQWTAWLDLLSTLRLDSGQVFQMPPLLQIPALEISSLVIALTLVSVSMLWLVGNGLLLRKQR
jgi:hypothetical protein